jgi:hypothetical protein
MTGPGCQPDESEVVLCVHRLHIHGLKISRKNGTCTKHDSLNNATQ